MIITRLATSDSDLKGILELQSLNLRKNLQAAEAARHGFLIAEYSFAALQCMNQAQPSIIALDGDQVVAYALAANRSVRDSHPLLADQFNQVDQLLIEGKRLSDLNYVVVAHVCVAREHQGLGVLAQLYAQFREALQGTYCCAIADVARENTRSLQAHLKVGFRRIHQIESEGQGWDVLLWDWREVGA